MFCGKCGKKLPDEAKFCTDCGHELPGKDNLQKANDEIIFYVPDPIVVNEPTYEPKPSPVISPIEPNFSQQQKPKKKGRAGVVIAIILVLALAAGAAWWFFLGGSEMFGGKKNQIEVSDEVLEEIIALEDLEDFDDPLEITYAKVTESEEYELIGVDCKDEYITIKAENKYVIMEAGYIVSYSDDDGEWLLENVDRNDEYCEYGHGFISPIENISKETIKELVTEYLQYDEVTYGDISISKHEIYEGSEVELTVTYKDGEQYFTADADGVFMVTPDGWYIYNLEITDKREAEERDDGGKIPAGKTETKIIDDNIPWDKLEITRELFDEKTSYILEEYGFEKFTVKSYSYDSSGKYHFVCYGESSSRYSPAIVDVQMEVGFEKNEGGQWNHLSYTYSLACVKNLEILYGDWEYSNGDKEYKIEVNRAVNEEKEYGTYQNIGFDTYYQCVVTLGYTFDDVAITGTSKFGGSYQFFSTDFEGIALTLNGDFGDHTVAFRIVEDKPEATGWYIDDKIHLTKNGAQSMTGDIDFEDDKHDSAAKEYHFDDQSGLYYCEIDGGVEVCGKSSMSSAYEFVEIPSEINGMSVIEICPGGFGDYLNITAVIIPKTVKVIGNYAFSGCTKLETVIIKNSAASIGKGAFMNCSALSNVELGDSITSIGDNAFGWCNISSIDIPSTVTSIGLQAFATNHLVSVTIPASVTTIGKQIFFQCHDLTDIYCEASSKPTGWDDNWNEYCKATVHWGDKSLTEIGTTASVPADIAAEINILSVAKMWSMFVSKGLNGEDYGFWDMAKYLDENSPAYEWAYEYATGIHITFVSPYTPGIPPFTNEKVYNFKWESDDCFSVNVSFDRHIILSNGNLIVDSVNYTYYFIKNKSTGNMWKLYEVKEITE